MRIFLLASQIFPPGKPGRYPTKSRKWLIRQRIHTKHLATSPKSHRTDPLDSLHFATASSAARSGHPSLPCLVASEFSANTQSDDPGYTTLSQGRQISLIFLSAITYTAFLQQL